MPARVGLRVVPFRDGLVRVQALDLDNLERVLPEVEPFDADGADELWELCLHCVLEDVEDGQ